MSGMPQGPLSQGVGKQLYFKVVRFPGGRKMFIDVQDIEAFIQNNKITINSLTWRSCIWFTRLISNLKS